MPDPYEVDDEGNPVAEDTAGAVEAPAAEAAPTDPVEQEALRRQVDQTLRFMRVQTAVVFIVLLILIGVLSDIRGVMIIVTLVFLFTSLAAYMFLSRTLNKRVLGRR